MIRDDSALFAWFQSLDRTTRQASAARLTEALGDIVALDLALGDQETPSLRDLLRRSAKRLKTALAHTPPPTRDHIDALVTALTVTDASTDTDHIDALVFDATEILFLPREARAEYRRHTEIAPPFVIQKILLEYALFSCRLDRLMAYLNKAFCRDHCPSPPLGCCHILGYDLGLVPDRMLAVQALEATRNGWTRPSHPDLEKCRYHTASGCVLRLFKTPACIGAMCRDVETHLEARFHETALVPFSRALMRFRNCDIDRSNVFDAMMLVLRTGESLFAHETPAPISGHIPRP